MKKVVYTLIFIFITSMCIAQIDANSLMGLPTAADITEITGIANPPIGSIVFNLDDEQVYRYTGPTNGWQRGFSEPRVFTGSFIISGEGLVTVSGIPFEPTQVTFVANANVESLDLDSDNGTGDNERGIENSFGTMNGFVRDTGGIITQQVIFGGAHANSINDLSRYASSSNCIGVRYGDQNGFDLGKIEGAFDSFTADGFSITINYTDGEIDVNSTNPIIDVQPDDVNNESLVVLYTAYK